MKALLPSKVLLYSAYFPIKLFPLSCDNSLFNFCAVSICSTWSDYCCYGILFFLFQPLSGGTNQASLSGLGDVALREQLSR